MTRRNARGLSGTVPGPDEGLSAEAARLRQEAAAVRVARALGGGTQGEFARRAGVAPSLLSLFEGGHSRASSDHLNRLAAAAGVPLSFLEQIVQAAQALVPFDREAVTDNPTQLRKGTAAGVPGDLVSEISRRLAASIAPTLAAVGVVPVRPRATEHADAEALWRLLAPLPARERRRLALGLRGAASPAFCALVCDASFELAFEDSVKASELAELALAVAEKLPAPLGTLAQGYALAFAGHAKERAHEFLAAEAAFARSAALLATLGEFDRHSCFPLARVYALEASLRRVQGRVQESLALIDRAIACGPSPFLAQWILEKVAAYENLGDLEAALATRRSLLAPNRSCASPDILWVNEIGAIRNLLGLGRPADAAARLPRAQTLAGQVKAAPALLATRAVYGEILAALGESTQALVELGLVREEMVAANLFADAALVTAHELAVLLREDRPVQARTLVRGMRPTIEALELPTGALAAWKNLADRVEANQATEAMAHGFAAELERRKLISAPNLTGCLQKQ